MNVQSHLTVLWLDILSPNVMLRAACCTWMSTALVAFEPAACTRRVNPLQMVAYVTMRNERHGRDILLSSLEIRSSIFQRNQPFGAFANAQV